MGGGGRGERAAVGLCFRTVWGGRRPLGDAEGPWGPHDNLGRQVELLRLCIMEAKTGSGELCFHPSPW